MRRSIVRNALAVAALACMPRLAVADIIYPPIPGDLDPSTVVWFYGCAVGLPGACVTAGVARQLPSTPHPTYWNLFYTQFLKTPSGTPYSPNDIWKWSLPDGSCRGVAFNYFWDEKECFITTLRSEVLSARVDWQAPFPIGEIHEPITLTALVAPEPGSFALVASGLALLGAVVAPSGRYLRPAA
jgi:hypothetical protein